ncbi:MAG TPA: ion transporter [Geminicoccaceae bacterium]|nr:ion transporter [Geminicoccaceae bacterium]
MRRTVAAPRGGLRATLRELYFGRTRRASVFQGLMLGLDLLTLAYFLVTTFVHGAPWMRVVDVALGLILLLEFGGRLLATKHPMEYLESTVAMVDMLVIASLLASVLVDNVAFLRLVRALRLLRSYPVLARLQRRLPVLRRNDEVIQAGLNVFVFLLFTSALVYVTQEHRNEGIENFVDALYFTVTSLTTTGYGDILLKGMDGRLLSIAIMIVGISLFLRLVQAVFRPHGKVRFPCPRCGLQRHDPDAVHCKACGLVLAIPNDES